MTTDYRIRKLYKGRFSSKVVQKNYVLDFLAVRTRKHSSNRLWMLLVRHTIKKLKLMQLGLNKLAKKINDCVKDTV